MRANLRAGVAIYNEGRFHAAHDAWEDYWLDLDSGTDDELLLHGLIQFTAVVYHLEQNNDAGAQGLAESATGYLSTLPADYRGIDLANVRPFLETIAADPARARETEPPKLRHDGQPLGYDDLDFAATAIVATVLAEEDGYDLDAIEAAIAYAREEIDTAGDGPFTGLVFAFVREPDRRATVVQRLQSHVDRERGKEADVDGLFEKR